MEFANNRYTSELTAMIDTGESSRASARQLPRTSTSFDGASLLEPRQPFTSYIDDALYDDDFFSTPGTLFYLLLRPGDDGLSNNMNDEPALQSVDHDFTHRQPATSPNMEAATPPADDAPVAPAPLSIPTVDGPPPPPATTTTTTTAVPSLDAPISLPDAQMSLPGDLHMPIAPDFPIINGAMDMGMGMGMDMDMDMGIGGFMQPAPAEQRLSAFARLRFDDGSYYMHTYQIILGRNVKLAQKDMRRLVKADMLKANGETQKAEALLNGMRRKKDHTGAKSVISEAGGIVNAPVRMMPKAYQQRRQSIASQALSTGTVPPEDSKEPEHVPQDILMQAFPEAPDTFEPHITENPNDCPLVPIHPQIITDRTGRRGPKGISREHAKIFYDFDHGNFCLAVLGSNGLHHESKFLPKGACVELNHGDTITVGMVEMTFFLPDIALTEEQHNHGPGSESQSRPMSFSFENGQGESEEMDSSASDAGFGSVDPRRVYHQPTHMFDSDDDDMADVDDLHYDDPDSPVRRKPSLKLKLKTGKSKARVPPPNPSKPAHKRKHAREPSPEEPPVKKSKIKTKEAHKEPQKEKGKEREKGKASKIPAKVPSKAPSKVPAKAPTKTTKDETPKAISLSNEGAEPTPTSTPAISTESPDAVRKPELPIVEPGDGGGAGDLITAEFAKRYNLPEVLIGQYLEKRKGPGRPPKDGMMSKRQKSQLVKRGKEIEKAQAAGIDPADLPQPIAKPKIVRRKESNAGEDEDVRETTEKGDAMGTPGDKKPAKPSKPVRTPSPELRITDYTEEQLTRPPSNYVVLIHEAISSSTTGQMNLQQIYNYIEKTYPWYKFRTQTSGWQSSVRHNLGQHDAFVKGDKEGKGYMWRINPNVSIEKERRKRHPSPGPVNPAQRQQGYYPPPPNGYPHYSQPGYYPGPPHGLPPNGPPRPPPSEPPQPRLPPSMARNAGSSMAAAPPSAPTPSPYASPWAGGNPAGSPVPNPPRPYPQPSAQAPVTSAAYGSGQYGVLYPTSAPPASYPSHSSASPYANQHATASPSPYGPPSRPHYPHQAPSAGPSEPSPPVPNAQAQQTPTPQPQAPARHSQYFAPHHNSGGIPHPSGRYRVTADPELIRQLEAFRTVYLEKRVEAGGEQKIDNKIRADEEQKIDNTIRAYMHPELVTMLTPAEHTLLTSIKSIPKLQELEELKKGAGKEAVGKVEDGTAASDAPAAIATAAAIAADAAANTVPNNSAPSNEPHKFTPNMTGQRSDASQPRNPASAPTVIQSQRPSVEPLTPPVPGSPAMQNGSQKLPIAASAVPAPTPAPGTEDATTGAQQPAKAAADPLPAPSDNTV
ncbi:hypothetical protein CC80DRAFT_509648 [Byssothecium circinans]|uniref:Fork-head domain-containing protein n=1 Tax=Byssothecium circinans TaxID=147558 RepID=A0A6A5TCL4_9PLEO|nr:hypothetical protein CC80DRAFT_509648 [Byssothecium circinans]